ncbi:hypothetical protein BURKHO8Y_30148 [Burkholderia sp. 8Y]|nr:hypothetical protein BURKHO8Y_30148 [Burkholderia sp. 8Y]
MHGVRVDRLVAGDASEPLHDAVVRMGGEIVIAESAHIPHGLEPDAMDTLRAGKLPILRGHQRDDATAYAFGAHFVEVRVHRPTREIASRAWWARSRRAPSSIRSRRIASTWAA